MRLCNDFVFIMQSCIITNFNVAFLAAANSPLTELSTLAWLCGILHDAGKIKDAFQNYIKRAMNGNIPEKIINVGYGSVRAFGSCSKIADYMVKSKNKQACR